MQFYSFPGITHMSDLDSNNMLLAIYKSQLQKLHNAPIQTNFIYKKF